MGLTPSHMSGVLSHDRVPRRLKGSLKLGVLMCFYRKQAHCFHLGCSKVLNPQEYTDKEMELWRGGGFLTFLPSAQFHTVFYDTKCCPIMV